MGIKGGVQEAQRRLEGTGRKATVSLKKKKGRWIRGGGGGWEKRKQAAIVELAEQVELVPRLFSPLAPGHTCTV